MDVTTLLAPLGAGLLVAALRASDVLLGTMRTAFVVNGSRVPAASLAGLEAAVWLSAAGIVFADPSPARFGGFVLGVAAGTFLGMTMIHVLKLGGVTVRVFVPSGEGRPLAGHLVADAIRARGFGATTFSGWGGNGPVDMVLSVVRRRDARIVCDVAAGADPDALVTIDNQAAPGNALQGGSLGVLGVRP
ncbi:MAG: DUF5698 domain-containing protein [Actinomycetota bacterium]